MLMNIRDKPLLAVLIFVGSLFIVASTVFSDGLRKPRYAKQGNALSVCSGNSKGAGVHLLSQSAGKKSVPKIKAGAGVMATMKVAFRRLKHSLHACQQELCAMTRQWRV